MRAVTFAGTEILVRDHENLTFASDEVVVAVAGAGLNAADLLQRQGFYPAPPGAPADIPGLEMAGVVVAAGQDVSHVHVGDRVCAILGGGGQATHCVVPADHLLAVPDHVDLVDAGGFAEGFTTAFDALVTQAELRAGERVCISGAAGGVGVAAIQIAALRGAHVTAVTRDPRHHEALRALGAHECRLVDDDTPVEPFDVLLELVGAAHLAKAQRQLGPRARVVVIGVGGGGRVELDLLGVMTKRLTVTGSTLRARSRVEKSHVAAAVRRELLTPWAQGNLRVPVAAVVDFDEVERAYEIFASPGKLGKIILRVPSGGGDR